MLALALAPLSAEAETTFRMAYVAPPPVWGPIADRFAKHVAEKTKGEIKIQSMGGGQLGNLPQNYAGLKTGQIDMMLADTGTLALARGGKDFNALFAPYVFRDHAHFSAAGDAASASQARPGRDNATVGGARTRIAPSSGPMTRLAK